MSATTDPRPGERIETVAELLDALEERPALGVDAQLEVTVDGHGVAVVGYDDLVAVDVSSLPAAVSLWRSFPVDAMDAAATLSSVDLTVELRVRGVPVARLGSAADPSAVARRLGLGPVELLPEGPLLAAVTRRRG